MTVFTTKKANVSNENDDAEMENRRQMKNWKAIAIIGLILLCVSMVLNIRVLVNVKNIQSDVNRIKSDVYYVDSIKSDVDDIKSAVSYIDSIKREVESIEGAIGMGINGYTHFHTLHNAVDSIKSDVENIKR